MNTESIICSGNKLAGTLADIRSKGGFIESLDESLDTCVGGKNAQYAVKYFNGIVAEDCGLSRKDAVKVAGVKDASGKNPDGESPSDPNQSPHCPTCSGHVTQGIPCSICAGIGRIRDGARRLRNRFRSSTREARLPHAND